MAFDDEEDRRQRQRREYDRELERWRGEVEARVTGLEREKATIETVAQAVVQVRIDMGVMRQELREAREEARAVAKAVEDGREADRKALKELLDRKAESAARWTLALVPPIATGVLVGGIITALGGHL